MKKLYLFFTIIFIVLLASCSSNGVEEFGNVSFYDDSEYQDTTFLKYDDKMYVAVSSDGYKFETLEYVAAINTNDGYSFKVYETEYDGILYINAYSFKNLARYKAIYADVTLDYIDGKLIEGFPPKKSLINKVEEITVNNITYRSYLSSTPEYVPGNFICEVDDKKCYEVEGEPQWISVPYETEAKKTCYRFYYNTSEVTSLPMSIILAGLIVPENK